MPFATTSLQDDIDDILAAHVNELGAAVNRLAWTTTRVHNIESPPYEAVPDAFFTDGVATVSSTTFTSAAASFTADDVGKIIVILGAGPSRFQDHHTTIASRQSATSVTLTDAPLRSQSSAFFYISRGGDQTAKIQAAVDAAEAQGGGMVYCPGVGYAASQVVLGNRVELCGAGGKHATLLHQTPGANKPLVTNRHTTPGASAMMCSVRNIWLDGNRQRQSDVTTTLGASYTAGQSTLTLTDASNFLYSGTVLIGTNRLHYESKSGNTLNNVTGGREATTDQSAANGATVTQHVGMAVYFAANPYNATPAVSEAFDPWFLLDNVKVKNTKGYGIMNRGQSEMRYVNVWVHYADHIGFFPSFDSWMLDCTADTCGRAGYYLTSSDIRTTNCKAFYNGGNVPAEGWGFLIEGPTSLEEGTKSLVNCSSQDNKADGYFLRLAQRVYLQGSASSNGTGGTPGQYAGIKIDSCSNGIIQMNCTDRRQDGTNTWQQNALHILGTVLPTNNMDIKITHAAAAGATVGPAIKPGSVITAGNNIQVNSQGGVIVAAYATPFTPDPYLAEIIKMTLTGPLTINAPANAHLGTKLTFMLQQDATGGRVVTFDAALPAVWSPSLAPNQINTISFVYDGTSWVQVYPSGDIPLLRRTLADVASTSNSVLTTLTDLNVPVAANTEYTFSYWIPYQSAATTTGLVIAMSAPASPGMFAYNATMFGIAADGTAAGFHGAGTANDDVVIGPSVLAANTVYMCRVDGILRTGATAGTLSIKFRSEISGSSVTVKRGSSGVVYVA